MYFVRIWNHAKILSMVEFLGHRLQQRHRLQHRQATLSEIRRNRLFDRLKCFTITLLVITSVRTFSEIRTYFR